MKRLFYIFIVLFLFSCARPLSWQVDTAQTGPYGPPTNVGFQLGSYNAGDTAAHTLTFDIKAGDMETYQAVITYPGQFTFNGFLALGPAGTQIGSYSVDFDFDGSIDFTIPVYSIDNNNAYADRDLFGSFNSPVDSTMVYSNSGGSHVFTTTLPFGGDGNAQTFTGPSAERIIAVINSGILTNPASAGTYATTGVFTSVDPDTDGADNSAGDPPLTLNFSQDIVITTTVTNNPPTAPELIYPADSQTGLGTTVEFKWKKSTDPDGDTVKYNLYYCTDQSFTGCSPISIDTTSLWNKGIYYAGYSGASLLLYGIVLAGGIRNRKRIGLLIAMIMIAGMLLVSCGGGNGGGNGDGDGETTADEVDYEISGLTTGTTYYWKVAADDSNGGITESTVRSFTTTQ